MTFPWPHELSFCCYLCIWTFCNIEFLPCLPSLPRDSWLLERSIRSTGDSPPISNLMWLCRVGGGFFSLRQLFKTNGNQVEAVLYLSMSFIHFLNLLHSAISCIHWHAINLSLKVWLLSKHIGTRCTPTLCLMVGLSACKSCLRLWNLCC